MVLEFHVRLFVIVVSVSVFFIYVAQDASRPIPDTNGNQRNILRRKGEKSHNQSSNVRITFNRYIALYSLYIMNII